jgi:hypothetical protein
MSHSDSEPVPPPMWADENFLPYRRNPKRLRQWFRDDHQCLAVVNSFLMEITSAKLWTLRGPTPEAIAISRRMVAVPDVPEKRQAQSRLKETLDFVGVLWAERIAPGPFCIFQLIHVWPPSTFNAVVELLTLLYAWPGSDYDAIDRWLKNRAHADGRAGEGSRPSSNEGP